MNRRSIVPSLGRIALWLGLASAAAVAGMFSLPVTIAAIVLAKDRKGKAAAASFLVVSLIPTISILLFVWHATSVQRTEDVLEAGLMLPGKRRMRDDLRNGIARAVPADKQEAAQKLFDQDVDRMEKLLDGVSDATLLAGYKKKRDDLRRQPGPPGPVPKDQKTVRLMMLDQEIDRLEKQGP